MWQGERYFTDDIVTHIKAMVTNYIWCISKAVKDTNRKSLHNQMILYIEEKYLIPIKYPSLYTDNYKILN